MALSDPLTSKSLIFLVDIRQPSNSNFLESFQTAIDRLSSRSKVSYLRQRIEFPDGIAESLQIKRTDWQKSFPLKKLSNTWSSLDFSIESKSAYLPMLLMQSGKDKRSACPLGLAINRIA